MREISLQHLVSTLSQAMPELGTKAISTETRLLEDLGLSSLQMILLALTIEDQYGVRIPAETSFRTVGDVLQFLNHSQN